MGRHSSYDLTDEQHDFVHTALPRIANLALGYMVSGYPTDGFFDEWSRGIVSLAECSMWGDEGSGLAYVDMAVNYEKYIRANVGRPRLNDVVQTAAEFRGALLRAGATLLAANNSLVFANKDENIEQKLKETFAFADEKLQESEAKFKALGLALVE